MCVEQHLEQKIQPGSCRLPPDRSELHTVLAFKERDHKHPHHFPQSSPDQLSPSPGCVHGNVRGHLLPFLVAWLCVCPELWS